MPAHLRWGIIGPGRINKRFVPGLQAAGHTISIIGSRDPERGRAGAAEFGAQRSGSYEDVVNAPDVDVVYIPLPNSLHREWTTRAAEAGKHILCEKPLAPTVADCEAMVAACQRHGVHLVEAFMYRYHPLWNIVRSAVDSGRIGQIRTFHAAFSFSIASGPNIRLSPELGGGALQDIGCYCINVARWFLGEPTRVRGVTIDNHGVGVDTHAAAALEYASGAVAALTCSFDSAPQQIVEIVGDKGRIEVEPSFVPSENTRIRIVDADGDHTQAAPVANSYALEVEAMERRIREGAPVLTPGSDAAATQAIIAAWRQSA